MTVDLQEGQTIAIAGLIGQNLREIVTKFPGLGEIPILGALFRSQEFINNESELVIIVTPHLAKPMRPEDIMLPTDHFVEPNDWEFYLLGRMEGSPKDTSHSSASASADTEEIHDIPEVEESAEDLGTLARTGHQIQ